MILLQYRSVRGFEYALDGRTPIDPDWHQHEHADDLFGPASDYYQQRRNDWRETRVVYQSDDDKRDQVVLHSYNDLPPPKPLPRKFWIRWWPAVIWGLLGTGYLVFWHFTGG